MAEGARVFASDVNPALLSGIEGAEVAQLDVTSTAAIEAYAESVRGYTTVLVNVAGFVHHGTILDCSEEDWDFSFDLNVKVHAPDDRYLPARHAAACGGSGEFVLHRQSLLGGVVDQAAPNRYVYGATKAAVDRADESCRARLRFARCALQRDLPWYGPLTFLGGARPLSEELGKQIGGRDKAEELVRSRANRWVVVGKPD